MNSQELLNSLRQLNPEEFESFVASVWSAMGWSTEVTQLSKDQGIDIVANKSGVVSEKVVIQAKRYNKCNKVGRPEIQQYNTLQQQVPDADSVIVVTSSDFTSEAISLAQELNLKTVHGIGLAEAAINHLSHEHLLDLSQHSSNTENIKEDNSRSVKKEISTSNLTESELDLAKFYEGYFRRLYVSKAGDANRSLIFDVKQKSSGKNEYTVEGILHHLKFPFGSGELGLQFQKTAEEYNWEILHSETYGKGAGGVEMIVPSEKADTFYICVKTGINERLSSKRQAKISSLVLKNVYGQAISGIEVIDQPHSYEDESYSRIIK